jgi:MFS family permease
MARVLYIQYTNPAGYPPLQHSSRILASAGWQVLFLVEALPAVLFGLVLPFWMADWPRDARWLDAAEKELLTRQYERELAAKTRARRYTLGEALRDREVLKLCLTYFLWVTGFWGFSYWMPTVLKDVSGWSNAAIGNAFAAAMLVSLAASVYTGHSSSKRNEKRWHGALHMFLAALGVGAAAFARDPWLLLLLLTLAAVGTYAPMSVWWSYPTTFLAGSAAAGAVGLINSVGNLGGFVGPYLTGWVRQTTGSFAGALLYLAVSLTLAGVLILTLRKAPAAATRLPDDGTEALARPSRNSADARAEVLSCCGRAGGNGDPVGSRATWNRGRARCRRRRPRCAKRLSHEREIHDARIHRDRQAQPHVLARNVSHRSCNWRRNPARGNHRRGSSDRRSAEGPAAIRFGILDVAVRLVCRHVVWRCRRVVCRLDDHDHGPAAWPRSGTRLLTLDVPDGVRFRGRGPIRGHHCGRRHEPPNVELFYLDTDPQLVWHDRSVPRGLVQRDVACEVRRRKASAPSDRRLADGDVSTALCRRPSERSIKEDQTCGENRP